MIVFSSLAAQDRGLQTSANCGSKHKLILMPVRNKSADPLWRALWPLAAPIGASLVKPKKADLIHLTQTCDLPLGSENRREGQGESHKKNKNRDAADGDSAATKTHFTKFLFTLRRFSKILIRVFQQGPVAQG